MDAILKQFSRRKKSIRAYGENLHFNLATARFVPFLALHKSAFLVLTMAWLIALKQNLVI